MNSACPSCGAVYAVTPKDVGRKIKCKKCSTALRVDDSGLTIDAPTGSHPPAVPMVPAAVVEDAPAGDDAGIVQKKKKRPVGRDSGGGFGELLRGIGGISTVLFGFGTFLVIFFTFMTPIGEASAERAKAAVQKLQNDYAQRLKKALPKGKKDITELNDDERKGYVEATKKINEDFEKQAETVAENAANADLDNVRSTLWDKYGQMFGFLFLAFGCIGYLRTDQTLVMRIVAAVILSFMMMVVFSSVGGGCGGSGIPKSPIGKIGRVVPG